MVNSMEQVGRNTQLNTIPPTLGTSNGQSGTVKQAVHPSVTVTYGGANKLANLIERDSVEGQKLARIQSGESPVPKAVLANALGVAVEEPI